MNYPSNLSVFSETELTRAGNAFYSPVVELSEPNNRWVPSWNVLGLSRVTVAMRWGNQEGWTSWRKRFVWEINHGRSVPLAEQDEDEEPGSVAAVTEATRCQLRLTASNPAALMVSSIALAHYREGEKRPYAAPTDPLGVWGFEIDVPGFSQLAESAQSSRYPHPKGGEVGRHLCFPSSIAETASLWGWMGCPIPPLEVAKRTYDPTREIYGDWSLNAATFMSLIGTDCYVASLASLLFLEEQVYWHRPVPVSIAWEEGELQNASQPKCAGHMVVVAGFTDDGDVIVHDPNTTEPSQTRRIFLREEFFAAWQRRAGVAFLLGKPLRYHSCYYE